MKLWAGLLLPGLWLLLLAGRCRVQAENQGAPAVPASSNGTKEDAVTPVPAALNGTNHTSAAPVVKPETNMTASTGNSTLSPIPSVVSSNTSTPATTVKNTTATTTNITATTATIAKTNAMKAPPVPPASPSVTKATPKAPSSGTAETATAKTPENLSRSSGFDVGSFIGGIVLTLGILILGYIGCRTCHAKRGIQYRTIDEHDAII